MNTRTYVGRFAPSPTGPLHPGSLVTALASWLDARAHRGEWLVRIEDIDAPRCRPGAAAQILSQLAACGLVADEPVLFQSSRGAAYQNALDGLRERGWAYACTCTRREIEDAQEAQGAARARHSERVYPGTCRNAARTTMPSTTQPSAIRVLAAACVEEPTAPLIIDWSDRRLGAQQQHVTNDVGDFVLQRSDGLWAYQLAVVVDDAAQGVTHVVRGEDLADNTPRQIHLQRLLGLPTPSYLHVPLLLGADGEKLSKRNGASAIDANDPADAVRQAAAALGLSIAPAALSDTLAQAVNQWQPQWMA